MKLGLHLYDFSWPGGASQLGPTLAQIPQTAEAAGFDRIGTVDHVWQSHYLGGPEHEVPSCYPTLTYLAAHTSRIKLIALATASPYWHPVLLAKTVTTLDVLSGGRAWLGIGAGDYEEEARGSGLPFPPLQERYERLEEMLQICLRMWQGEHGDERPWEALPHRAPAQPATESHAPPSADSDRRQRRAKDAAPGRTLRRRLQSESWPTDPAEIGDPAPAL